jgi:aryl-alcohol dehydrogenase-like predicted oxidoreductase
MSRSGRRMGRSDLSVSPVGLGCWQFSGGKGLVGGYWPDLPRETVDSIVAAGLAAGIDWFDTAELYGGGRSEATLAAALVTAGRKSGEVVLATKWSPFLRAAGSIKATIGERLARLSPFGIDLHQIHNPLALATVSSQMDAMADLVEEGRIRAVGVSNFSARRMRAAHRALARRGIPLASNQMPYSLLNRKIESRGVLSAARELGITIIAYSPLAQGILTGKFHRDRGMIKSRPGPRKRLPSFSRRGLERSAPLVKALDGIAAARGVTSAQVALNWLIHFHGETVVAIPGATRAAQATENGGAMDFRLDEEEMARLDHLSRPFL